MKLIASVLVHNELGRYLEPFVDHLLDFCEEIRVLDDYSTDGSCEYLCGRDRVEVLGGGPPSFFAHEGRTRQELLDWTLDGEPTHVLALDADEFVSDGAQLRSSLLANPDQVAWTLEMREVWRVEEELLWTREDGGWRAHPVPMLWRVPERIEVLRHYDQAWRIFDRPLAGGREPQAVRMLHSRRQSYPAGADALHFGWASPAGRRARYERYAVADGGRFHASAHLESILAPDSEVQLQALPWPPSLTRSSLSL